MEVISSRWEAHHIGSPAYILTKKLKATKVALKNWNTLHLGNIQNKITSLTHHVDLVQQAPHSPCMHKKELDLKKSLDNLLEQEEILWRNKLRETWLICKDLNIKFFHASTLIKRMRNDIDFIKQFSGEWISDKPAIGGCFKNHFTCLFSSSTPTIPNDLGNLFDTSISNEENLHLCSIPLEDDIFNALPSMGSTKAHRPDGYTALFYKKY